MKNFKFLTLFTLLIAATLALTSCDSEVSNSQNSVDQTSPKVQTETVESNGENSGAEYTSAYVCQMHCKGSGSDKPGKCPVCGMAYVKNENNSDGHEGHSH